MATSTSALEQRLSTDLGEGKKGRLLRCRFGLSDVPMSVLMLEVLSLLHHFVLRCLVAPWLLIWPAVAAWLVVGMGDGAWDVDLMTALDSPPVSAIVLWVVGALTHTANVLTNVPYEGAIKLYRDNERLMRAFRERREREVRGWRDRL